MYSFKRILLKILEWIRKDNEYLEEGFKNMWIVRVYDEGGTARVGFATPDELRKYTCYYQGIFGMSQSLFADAAYWEPWGLYNYYTAWFTSYVYCSQDKTVTTTVYHDDQASVWVNNKLIVEIPSTTATSINISFKKGWNRIDAIYSEGTGTAGLYFNPRLETLVDKMIPFLYD